MVHHLKIKEPFADAIISGNKTFEVRFNDRGYQKGDYVVFEAVDELNFNIITHPINGVTYKITYVLNGWGLKDDYVAFSIKK